MALSTSQSSAAIREVLEGETDISTGTRSRLIRRVVKTVEAAHGEGVVPLPSTRTLYKLIDALATAWPVVPSTG